MAVKTYDPKENSLIVGSRPITGFADGTYITVRRNEDAYTLQVGVTGKGVRSKNNNRSGEYEIVLQQGADDNEYLSELALADELSNGGLVPILVKNNLGSSVHGSAQAWVKKQPDNAYDKENGTRTWIFTSDNVNMFTGRLKNN